MNSIENKGGIKTSEGQKNIVDHISEVRKTLLAGKGLNTSEWVKTNLLDKVLEKILKGDIGGGKGLLEKKSAVDPQILSPELAQDIAEFAEMYRNEHAEELDKAPAESLEDLPISLKDESEARAEKESIQKTIKGISAEKESPEKEKGDIKETLVAIDGKKDKKKKEKKWAESAKLKREIVEKQEKAQKAAQFKESMTQAKEKKQKFEGLEKEDEKRKKTLEIEVGALNTVSNFLARLFVKQEDFKKRIQALYMPALNARLKRGIRFWDTKEKKFLSVDNIYIGVNEQGKELPYILLKEKNGMIGEFSKRQFENGIKTGRIELAQGGKKKLKRFYKSKSK